MTHRSKKWLIAAGVLFLGLIARWILLIPLGIIIALLIHENYGKLHELLESLKEWWDNDSGRELTPDDNLNA